MTLTELPQLSLFRGELSRDIRLAAAGAIAAVLALLGMR
jgi:hypothetical protein